MDFSKYFMAFLYDLILILSYFSSSKFFIPNVFSPLLKYFLDLSTKEFLDKEENIKLEVENGYLIVHATIDNNNEEKEEGKFVRKERYMGSCSRSFYVGDEVKSEDVKASFKNGTLKIENTKKEENSKLSEKKYIQIDG